MYATTVEGRSITLSSLTAMSLSTETLQSALLLAGAEAVALVDVESGECLQTRGTTPDIRGMARHNAEVLRARLRAMILYSADEEIEDLLLTTSRHYQVLRFVPQADCAGLFLYLVLNRTSSNLALARHKLATLAKEIYLSSADRELLAKYRAQTQSENSIFGVLSVPPGSLSPGLSPGRVATASANGTTGSATVNSTVANGTKLSPEPEEGETEEELPPFMRLDSVMRILGISSR